MSNFIPYLILLVICTLALSVLVFRIRAAWPLILLLAFAGMIYVFEFFIFVLYNSYTYHPEIIGTAYYDNVLGAVFSNLFSVPVGAAYIAIYQLSWRWIAFLAVVYGVIEIIFLGMGIYDQQWWNTGFTVVALLIFFRLARQWPIWLSGHSRGIKFITLVMYAWTVVATMVYILAITKIRMFHIGRFEDPYHDDIFISAMYGFGKAVVLALAVTVSHRAWIRVSWLLVILAGHLILMKLGILNISLPLWQYWLIYAPCCIFVLWLVAVSKRTLDQFRMKV